MEVDWRRLRAVVIESDDWGLCAWVPDERAHAALRDQPAFRSPAGSRYGRSTLETAADVRELSAVLSGWRGGDGFPPVLQANTVVANPDYDSMRPPFDLDGIPVLPLPSLPSRWQRPGLLDAVRDAETAGVWWAELHGLTHLPEGAWLAALRRGDADALRAFEQQSPIGVAVEASGEYDRSEPRERRSRSLHSAVRAFRDCFGRAPVSLCPPDYRFDEWLEGEAAREGLTILQGVAEQAGMPLPAIRRRLYALRFPMRDDMLFRMPPRIAFEPAGDAAARGRRGLDAAHGAVRRAWLAGRPAVISTHRMSYAHLDPEWSRAGREALNALLQRLCADGAVFLVDHEVEALVDRAWSVRAVGRRGALLRHYGDRAATLRFPAPAGAAGVTLAEAGAADGADLRLHSGRVEARVPAGEYLLEWAYA